MSSLQYLLYLLSVSLHLLAAAVWIGGMVFLGLVLIPVIRRPEHRGVAANLIHWTGLRFRMVGWVCLAVLLLSGAGNLVSRNIGWMDLWSGTLVLGPFNRTLSLKLLLVTAILFLSAFHDFHVGPRATEIWRDKPDSPEARRLRVQASWIGRLNLVLALIVFALGVVLARGGP
jgi:putative copper export protein